MRGALDAMLLSDKGQKVRIVVEWQEKRNETEGLFCL